MNPMARLSMHKERRDKVLSGNVLSRPGLTKMIRDQHMCTTRHACFSGEVGSTRTGAVALRRLQAKLYAERLHDIGSNGDETPPRFLIPSKSYPGVMHQVISDCAEKLAVHNEVNGSEHRHLRVLVPFLYEMKG